MLLMKSTFLCLELEDEEGKRPTLKTKGMNGRQRESPYPQVPLCIHLLGLITEKVSSNPDIPQFRKLKVI